MSQLIILAGWWLLTAGIGLLAWPLAFRLLNRLPDRGYSAARPLGLLLGSYTWWLLGSMGFLNTSLGSVIIALLVMGGLSTWFYYAPGHANDIPNQTSPSSPIRWLQANRTYVITYELLLLLAFAGWACFRAHSPAINHTEKPMEFAFMNAILRSPGFPPNDPWLSGYSNSYYYMGYVMMALLTRLSGSAPGVAYNTAHAWWFALFAASALGVAYNLVAANQTRPAPSRALLYGLLAAVMLVGMGNLGGALELAHQNGVGSAGFWQWLDIADLAGPPTSSGGLTPQRGGWWWWRASRIINDYKLNGNSQHNDTTVIDEFPHFSFILGDMHPHVLVVPFTLLAISLAFNLYRSSYRLRLPNRFFKPQNQPASTLSPPSPTLPQIFVYAVVLGGLGFLNTWDYPIYLVFMTAAYSLRRWQEEGRLSEAILLEAIGLGLGLGLTGYLAVLPFYFSLETQPRGVFPNLFNGARLSHFFVMFGPFLVIGGSFVLSRLMRARRRVMLTTAGWTALALAACILLTLALGFISPEGRSYLQAWLRDQPLPGMEVSSGDLVVARLVGRLLGTATLTPLPNGASVSVPGAGPWLVILLMGIIMAGLALWGEAFANLVHQPEQAEHLPMTFPPSAEHFAMLLLVTGAAMALSVEFVFIGDAFGTRMNTVFKFYYQVWVLWSIASAYGLYHMAETETRPGVIGRVAALGLAGLFILAGLVYPLMAIPSRVDHVTPPTLDGTAYLARENPDEYAAIAWLNANVTGAPVILETPGDSFQAHTSRVSGYTGLPTLLGWQGHESQWRKTFVQAGERNTDIQEIYNSRNAEQVQALINKYNIDYIYVGSLERAKYSPAGLAKFKVIADVVFEQGSASLYKTRR